MKLAERLVALARTRAARITLKVLAVALILRALLALAQPLALDAAARAAGLDCEYDELELSLLHGELRLRGLVLRDPLTSEPALELDFLLADLALLDTLAGAPTVERIEVDGVRARATIDEQGRIDWLERVGTGAPAPALDAETDDPQPLDLGLPLVVRELRATRIELRASDRRTAPALDVALGLDASASNLGADGRFELWATSPQLLDTLRVEGRIEGGLRSALLELEWRVEGLRPARLAPRLAALGLDATARRVDSRGKLSAGLQPAPHDELSCSGGLALRDVELAADGETIASLSELALALRALAPGRVELASLRIVQPRLQAVRDANGRIGVPGFAWAGAPNATTGPQSAGTQPAGASSAPLSLALDLFVLEEARASLRDLTGHAPELEVELGGELVSLEWPPQEGANAQHSFHLRAPGVVEQVSFGGDLLNEDQRAAVSIGYRAEGLTLARLAPWLEPLGIAPELAEGRSEGQLKALVELGPQGPKLDVTLLDLMLEDGESLASLKGLQLNDLKLDASGALAVDSLEIIAPRLRARRSSDGALHAFGLRLAPPTAPQSTTPPAPTSAPALAVPALRIGKFDLQGAELALRDESPSKPVEHRLHNASVQLTGLDTTIADAVPASFACALGIDGVIEELSLAGSLDAQRAPHALELAASLQARGIDLAPLDAYLATLGLSPALGAGELRADLSLSAHGDATRIERLDARIEQVAFEDGERQLAALESLRVDGLELGASRPEIAAIVVRVANVELERGADGSMLTCGLRLAPPTDATSPDAIVPSETVPETTPAPLRLALPALELGELRVEKARIGWRDSVTAPQLGTALVLDARVVGLVSDAPTPAQVSLRAEVENVAEELSLQGELALRTGDASALQIDARLAARGLRSGPLAAYLPSGLECTLENGSASAELRARAAAHPAGGVAATLLVERVAFVDGERPLAALRRASIDVERADPSARVYAVRELAVEGIELAVEREPSGALETLGLRVAPQAVPTDPPVATDAPAAPRRLPSWFGPLPTISVERLALELARLELRDEGLGASARPLALSASLASREPLALLAPQAEKLPPLRLDARASVAGLCDALECDLVLAPWANAPSFDLTLRVRGLHGEPLLEHLPSLAGKLHGRELQSGEFDLHVDGEFGLSRRGPLGIDWAAGIKGTVKLDRCEFRAQSGGEVLAGLQRARAEIARLDPQRGELQLKSLELSTPRLRAARDAEGLHLLGLVIALPPPSTAPSESAPAVVQDPAPASAASTPPADTDFAIARLDLDGIDVEFVDRTGPEPVLVPLKKLDFELRKFSTRSLARGGSVQFQAVLEPGPVSLPRHVRSSSLVGGIAKATAAALKGAKESAEREERPLFSSITLAGRIAPLPAPTGWVTLDVSEFELTGVRGLASQQGIEIGDGLLDLSVRARLGGASGASVQATTSLAHLRLSEPPNGPISRYLALPAPLDTVLFLLEDAEGRQRIPVSLRLGPKGAHPAELATAAATAAAVVIGRAVASSPLRVLGTFTDALGLTGNPAPKPGDFARSFDFEPGDGGGAADDAALEALARRLAADPSLQVTLYHEFGAADLARAERLASPDADDCRALVARARERKAGLARRREELAAEARIEIALGRETEAEELRARVRALDVELGLAEAALDRLLELLLPGSERRAPQRTRAAALAIADERLERIRQALLARGIAPGRIETRPARSLDPAQEQGGRVTALPRRKS